MAGSTQRRPCWCSSPRCAQDGCCDCGQATPVGGERARASCVYRRTIPRGGLRPHVAHAPNAQRRVRLFQRGRPPSVASQPSWAFPSGSRARTYDRTSRVSGKAGLVTPASPPSPGCPPVQQGLLDENRRESRAVTRHRLGSHAHLGPTQPMCLPGGPLMLRRRGARALSPVQRRKQPGDPRRDSSAGSPESN